jgi:hypothetical protein
MDSQEARGATRMGHATPKRRDVVWEATTVSNRELRHYTTRLRHSRRMRYRIARLLVTWLPLLLFLYALLLSRTH